MERKQCGRCSELFTMEPGRHPGFCPSCIAEIHSDASAAHAYRRRIEAGDVNVKPETEQDRETLKAAIRKRFDPATRDTRYSNR